MAIYITILLSVMLISTIGQNYSVKKEIHLGQHSVERRIPSLLTTLVICAILIFFFAARWNVGTDFPNYFSRFYKLLGMSISELIGSRDWGFYVLTAFIGKYVFTDFFLYSLILGAIIYIPVIMTYRRFSSNFTMTCALYIMMCLYTWPYNGMRQAVAVSLLFMGFPLLYEKKELVEIYYCGSNCIYFPFNGNYGCSVYYTLSSETMEKTIYFYLYYYCDTYHFTPKPVDNNYKYS